MSLDEENITLDTLYSEYWQGIFLGIARQKYSHIDDADELMQDSRQLLAIRVSEQHSQYPSKPLSKAYIVTSFKHCLIDVIRQKKGYPRPSQWLKAQGELGELLFDLLCIRKYTRSEIFETVSSYLKELNKKLSIKTLINEMERRQECAGKIRQEYSIESSPNNDTLRETVFNIVAGENDQPEISLEQEQMDEILSDLVKADYVTEGQNLLRMAVKISTLKAELGNKINLTDNESYALRAFYLQGMSYADIATVIDGSNERKVRYLCKKAIDKIKKNLDELGLDRNDLLSS